MKKSVFLFALCAFCVLSAASAANAAEIELGEQRNFYVDKYDKFPPYTAEDSIIATLYSKTASVYYFVADDAYGQNGFTSDTLDEWVSLFEVKTVGKDGRGVYTIASEALGAPKFNDEDDRLFVLFHNFGVAPYRCQKFAYWREADFNASGMNRNARDIIYVHAQSLDSEYKCSSSGVQTTARKVAFPEAILSLGSFMTYGADPDESMWVPQGAALRLLYLTGYYEGTQSTMDWRTDVSYFTIHASERFRETSRGTYYEYNNGALLLFFSYLEDYFGKGIIQKVAQSEKNDFDGVGEGIAAAGGKTGGVDFYGLWTVANIINSGREFSYSSISTADVVATKPFKDLNGDKFFSVAAWSTEYVSLPTDSLSANDKMRLTLSMPQCGVVTPAPAECQNADLVHFKVVQIQQPKDLSVIEKTVKSLDPKGYPLWTVDLAGFGASAPKVFITATLLNEETIPVNFKIKIEINPDAEFIDGDIEAYEEEAAAEEEQAVEDEEEEPDDETAVEEEFSLFDDDPWAERRDRSGSGGSSSGCASEGSAAFGALLLFLLYARKKRALTNQTGKI